MPKNKPKHKPPQPAVRVNLPPQPNLTLQTFKKSLPLKLTAAVLSLTALGACSTPSPQVVERIVWKTPACPKPPPKPAPPEELMTPPSEPYSHFDAKPDPYSQLLLAARNYGDVFHPARDRLIQLQEWVRGTIHEH